MGSLLGHKLFTPLVLLYTLALTIGSLIKPVRLLEDPPTHFDKLLHAGAYFGLALLWMVWSVFRKPNGTNMGTKKKLCLIGIAAIVYGIIIELLQGALTSYRTPDILDILANSSGAIVALVLVLIYINKIELLKTRF